MRRSFSACPLPHFTHADFESTERDLPSGVPGERLTRDRAVRCLQESGATLQTATGAQEDRSLGSAADAGLALVDRGADVEKISGRIGLGD
jgi:hypothetical protein